MMHLFIIKPPSNASKPVLFAEDTYYHHLLNSQLFSSTTLRYLISLQNEVSSFLAKVEDRFMSLRMVLSSKIERAK
ncbi:hypothetical protein EON64_02045 [archaeon]|nr:MAG: hypothetical protein EON64_02045 [archaeon]